MDRLAQQKQANEIATRLDNGEAVTALAAEYGLERTTIWRRANQGLAQRMPGMDDDQESRQELTGIIWRRIMAASERGDDKALVPLIDRLTKMNGLDHAHRVDLARLKLHAAEIELLAQTMTKALEAADVPIPQRRKVLELIANANTG